jgi:RNA-binding protein YhbY
MIKIMIRKRMKKRKRKKKKLFKNKFNRELLETFGIKLILFRSRINRL